MTTILRLDVRAFDDTELGAEVRAVLGSGGVVVGEDVQVTHVVHRCSSTPAEGHLCHKDCVACGDEDDQPFSMRVFDCGRCGATVGIPAHVNGRNCPNCTGRLEASHG